MNDCSSAQKGVPSRNRRDRHVSFGEVMGPHLSNVRYGVPAVVQGLNTFILWESQGRIKMKFETEHLGADNILHILTTAAEFRQALQLHALTGSQVEVYQTDGSVFVYTYHEAER